MVEAHIGLGSNLGDRREHLRYALDRLQQEQCRVTKVSSLYETEAVDCPGGKFLNAVAVLETALAPNALLELLLKIEQERGRTRSAHTEARTLDLDLLLYGQEVIETETLTIPHPRMHERAFVLIPLTELSPNCELPRLGETTSPPAGQQPDLDDVRLVEHDWWSYDGYLGETFVPNIEPAALQESATRNKATVRKHLQFWEQMDIPAFLALFADDARQISPFASGLFREQVVGKDELRAYWESVPSQFSSINLSIEGIYALEDPNRVFAHYRGEMTLRDGSGVYENDYYSLFRFNDRGEIAEHVKLFNPIATARTFGLLDQIR